MEKIEKIAAEISQREGCELYDIEMIGAGNGRVLRVFIDKESGVGIEDCSNVSKGLNLLLDVEDIVPGGMYNLEVSSPGLDRHLRTLRHFEKAVGKKIFVQLDQSLGSFGAQDKSITSMKKFENILDGVEDEQLAFTIRDEQVKVPLSAITKAKVVFEMPKPEKPGQSKKKK